MSLNMAAVISRVREVVAEVTSLERVYAASEAGAHGIPAALREFPCAVVFPGPDTGRGYILSSGQHQHTYEVKLHIYQAGALSSERAATVLPMVDRIIERFVQNVTLGSLVTSCLYRRQSGMAVLGSFGGGEYTGYEIVLEVTEHAPAAPAVGS